MFRTAAVPASAAAVFSLDAKERIMPNVFRGKGNLGDTPILKHVPINGADEVVAEMRVFFDDYAYDQANDEYQQVGGFWMRVSLWGQRGEEAAREVRRVMPAFAALKPPNRSAVSPATVRKSAAQVKSLAK